MGIRHKQSVHRPHAKTPPTSRSKPVVAILADFPAWEVAPQLEQSLYWWHFSVWLSELRQALEEQDEYGIHWVLLDKRPSSPMTLTRGKQTFHILPRARLMEEAWCLVHSSKADTDPTSVKEARVVGLPVVLTTECGGQQHVCHGESGFILAPDDVGGFVRAVRTLTASRDLALSMGRHGWQECRRALHRATMLHRLCELYRSILAA